MYIPKYFEVTDKNEIFAFVQANTFGQLISNAGARPLSTHIPFLLSDDKIKLFGHLARQNPQLQDIDGQEVLVTLQGSHDYISPSWYVNPGVPTWNYQAVHIYGRCKTFTDTGLLKQVVNSLTSKYEAKFSNPWQPDYNPAMLKAIVGLEINIDEIQCKYKLSQNKTADDRARVIEQLKANGSNELAQVMLRNHDRE